MERKDTLRIITGTDDGFAFKDLAGDNYNYFDWEWFTLPKDSGLPVWTEPYFDLGGSNVLMSTYAMPFFGESDTGRYFRGVITADLSLGWLEEMMNSIKVFESGYVILISDKGTVITHPVSGFQMHNLSELAKDARNESMARLAEEMMKTGEGYLPFISLINQQPCWMYYTTISQTGWRMAVVFIEDELFAGLQNLYLFTVIMGLMGIVLLSVLVILFATSVTKPLRKLTMVAHKIGSGDFEVNIKEDRSTREIYLLGSAFRKMQTELKEYVKNLELTTAAKERFESELNIAHDIQQGMIPKIFPPFPERTDIDIYALLEPARQVGGDFYDFFFLDEENLCFAVGDVSDKGVPAALMMAMTITLFRAKSDLKHEVHELVSSINNDISKDNVNMMFITFFMGILNLRTGKMKYCNAGHNYPMVIKHDHTAEFLSETHGIPLGISEHFVYSAGEMIFERGDTLVLYTDGITEALSIRGDFYGDDRFADLIRKKNSGLTANELCNTIMEDVDAFTRNPERSDDITLMVLSYYPPEKQI
jgi:sigma-B regulation protein RsbU (phosphoserine phosphatase)